MMRLFCKKINWNWRQLTYGPLLNREVSEDRAAMSYAVQHVQCRHMRIVDVYTHIFLTSALIYTRRKSPQYPSDRRLGGSQSRSGRCGAEITFLSLSGIEPFFIQPLAGSNTDWAIPAPYPVGIGSSPRSRRVKLTTTVHSSRGSVCVEV
jgi:hypothetical protein